MKKVLISLLLLFPLMLSAQATYGNLSPLSVDGGLLKDVNGNVVRLHGVSDTPSPAANNNQWGEVSEGNITKCVSYFGKLYTSISSEQKGTNCNAFCLQIEPAWTQDATLVVEGAPEYKSFSPSLMRSYTTKLYWKLILSALRKGLYVVVSAPDNCPSQLTVGDDYQQYLCNLWESFTQNDSILKYSGQISLQLSHCPESIQPAEGGDAATAMKDYFQPVIKRVHANGFGGILWLPAAKGTWVAGGKDDAPVLRSAAHWDAALQTEVEVSKGVSVMLGATAAYIDLQTLLETGEILPSTTEGAQDCWNSYAQLSADHPMFKPYRHYWSPDQGNGTFVNPIINGDFPDIDIIRVGDTYYLMSTTMYIFPGATIMKSKDLVNWEYCCNPLQKIDDNDAYNLLNGKDHYAQGQWATSMRYHDGKFYVYFISYGRSGVDGGRNVLLTATDPEGEWKMQYMNEHYYDSGWLFDDGPDGDGYLYVACGIGAVYVNKLDAKTLKKISSTKIFDREATEGSRMYHIGEYYYVYVTTGGYWRGQTIYRSKNPMGPYEEMPNLNKYGNEQSGNAFTNNAIHQGGLVETQTGEWWTIMFRDAGAIGRVPYLEPVVWKDGWPIIGNNGVDVSKNSKPYKKPDVGANYPRTYLPTNDSFTSLTLGKQWGWNHNHDDSKWSLLERPGHLRLHTVNVTDDLRHARNSLTQRIMGVNPEGWSSAKNVNSYGTIKLDVSGMLEGDVAGLAVFQDPYSLIGVTVRDGQKRIIYMTAKSSSEPSWVPSEKLGPVIKSDTIYLRGVANFSTSKSDLYYSFDNSKWTKYGDQMSMRFDLSIFVGQRFYIFNYATLQTGGYIDVDWFSTEPSFSEDMFYGEEVLHAYPAEEVTAVSLTASKDEVNMMPGSFAPVQFTCTMQSGAKINVTTGCQFQFATPGIVKAQGGNLVGVNEGTTDVTATYTDALGHPVSVSFTVHVSYFPLSTDVLDGNLIGSDGIVRVSSSYTTIKPSKNGMAGWHYANGFDLSDKGRYLIVRLNRTVTSHPVLRLYDVNDIKSTTFYAYPEFGTDTVAVFDLQEAANEIDLTHVYYVGFYLKTSSALQLTDVYLSDDGINPTAIETIPQDAEPKLLRVEFFTTDGRQHQGLKPGVNLVRKVFSDGRTHTTRILQK